ncbi:MAG: DUF2461 domain-containing protein [Rhodospirillaceae bacterium]
MPTSFPGFSKDFFKFFEELAQNNDRTWFEANKPRFQDVVQGEMIEFITAMALRLEKISPYYVVNPKRNGGSMFRIYRDVRFSKDKRPYKEHAACQFRHSAGRDAHAPGFYVHLEPGKVIFGGGIWKPPSDKLALIRRKIATDPAAWKKVIGNKRLRDTFGGVAGDALKRPPKGFDAETPNIDDIKRISFFAMRHEKASLARSKDFVNEVEKTFKAAAPLMKFITGALDVDF